MSAEAVRELLADCLEVLDGDRLEAWPELFLPDGCYRVLSRENIELGLPAPLVYYYSRGMMQDRVTAIRDALTFEFVYTRRLSTDTRVTLRGDGDWDARANVAIYQSTEEGHTRLFAVGAYHDVVTITADGARFRTRDVVVDTFGIQNLIAVPL
jgi:anthranilate 1,2-dioxygenase small subunit